MHDYRIKDFLFALNHNVHIEIPHILTFDDDNLHLYDMNTLALLKRFNIADIEMVTLLTNYKQICLNGVKEPVQPSKVDSRLIDDDCDTRGRSENMTRSFYFLVYRKNNLHVYNNNTIIKKIQLKNIERIARTDSCIYALTKNHLFTLDYDLTIQRRLDVPKNWSLVNDLFIGTKDGKLYDLEMKMIGSFGKEVSFVRDKNCIGFADGTFNVDRSSTVKRMKANVSGRVLYLDTQNIVTEHSFNGKRTPYTIKSVFGNGKQIYLLTDDNEIIENSFIVDNEYPVTDFFTVGDEMFYVKDRSLRRLMNRMSARVSEETGKESVTEEKWSRTLRESGLIISRDVLVMEHSIAKACELGGMIFLTDGRCIVIYYEDSVFVLATNCEIKGLCVDGESIVFGTDEGEVCVMENDVKKRITTENVQYDTEVMGTFYTELRTYLLEMPIKLRFSAHSEMITDLITAKDLVVSAERRRRVRIHDKNGSLINEIKATSNSLVRQEDSKGCCFLMVVSNKIRIYNNFQMIDEIEHVNDVNTCILQDKKVHLIDYKGNYVLYSIGKKTKETFNINRVFGRACENDRFKTFYSDKSFDLCPFSMRICNNTLVFAGNFFIFIEKYKVKDKEIIINELKNNKLNINYILQYNMSVNILENLLDNRVDGIEVTRHDGMFVLSKPFLSTISACNRQKYVNYLKKYINYSKYIGITQVLVKECLDAGMRLDCDMSRVTDWVENVHRDLVGMKLLFKNKEK